MSPTKIENRVYLIGVGVLGLFYYLLKSSIESDWVFVGICLVYLLSLRGLGYAISKLGSEQADD